jgi:hypothetical protein
MKTLTGQRNQCAGCGEYFNSNYAFDKHRTGKHGVDRRCRTKEEMLDKGMSVNYWGFWVSESFTLYKGDANEEGKTTDDAEPVGDGSKV